MRTRTVTALLLLAPVLAVLFANLLWPTVLLAFALYAVGRSELAAMFPGPKRPWPIVGTLLLSATAYILTHKEWEARFDVVVWPALVASAVGIWGCTRLMAGKRTRIDHALAELWVAAPLASLIAIQRLGEHANTTLWRLDNWIFLATVPIWAGDTLAILVGRTFGKRPLWPELSPKKTKEGSLANLLGALAMAIWLGIAMRIPPISAILVGLSAGLMGQAGDLFESTMKRVAGVKDSGTVLPGHGGILDRIDSVLGNASVAAAILLLSR